MRAQTFTPPFFATHANVFQHGPLRSLYTGLLEEPLSNELRAQAADFLDRQLQELQAQTDNCDLPHDPAHWQAWLEQRNASVGEAFQEYRQQRQAGAPRRYFRHRAHALHFLRSVAPTKLVDGAWLHGLLRHWRDPAYAGLIRIYLEELGGGRPDKNHVLLYRQLLASQDCADQQDLDDTCYQQGAIQLALGWLADDYLPELIGFNLGYEQLPLHLPISAFELAELGLDPYYFTLHVTVDNAASGHARMALESIRGLIPAGAEAEAFMRRLRLGYRLNDQGPGTLDAIRAFDQQQALIDVLTRKAEVGRHLHADYCRIEGRTVNQWLGEPGGIAGFLDALQRRGWIRRGEEASHSRFWGLIEGERAQMFGVFNGYERQLLRDWIETPTDADDTVSNPVARRRARPQPTATSLDAPQDRDSQLLAMRLKQLREPAARIDELLGWMTPARHHHPAGLLATREFCRLLEIPA